MSENLFFPDWDSTGGGGGESVHFFAAETQDMDRQDEVSRLAKAAKVKFYHTLNCRGCKEED